ncbi:MAG: hypothetical protein IJH04_09945 [Eggerthellaceae bacterium]|nr:hypothetical protein [Eggerthellaceae bacterium]
MLKEFGRVRVSETGMYGTIVDWRSSDDYCEVELDGWQHEGQIDGDRQLPYSFAISDLEELIEVGQDERKAVFDSFDTTVISSTCFMAMTRAPTIVIRRNGNSVKLIVQSWDYETDERKILDTAEASKLLSAVFAMHADRWTEPFWPEHGVLDGYSWTIDVYSGNRYFTCEGMNAVPGELVDLLYAVADAGLPLAWNGYEILLPSGSDDKG